MRPQKQKGSAFTSAATNGVRPSYTLTNLRRWDCNDESRLPPVNQIKAIHVYDFDNTLFASPLPNRQIWDGMSWGKLMAEDNFANGGWWHDPSFLMATGDGVEKEEPKSWSGWWNEQVAGLCELSHQQKDALCVLLTGRGEGKFADLVKRMIKSKGLSFDMVVLKPAVGPNNQNFHSTMIFKQIFLADLINTYNEAEEFRIYEDRVPHVKAFRDWLQEFNENLAGPNPQRMPLKYEVVEVAMEATNLEPVTEVAQVQNIINLHNTAYRAGKLDRRGQPLQIKSQVFNTGYLLKVSDTKKLIERFIPADIRNGRGVKIHADAIPIAMASANAQVLSAVGGIGHKVRFNITAIGQLEDRLWAVRVEPTNPREKIQTLNNPPSIVLALRDARTKDVNDVQKWQPIPPHLSFQIETTVGEKATLSIVPEATQPQKKRGREEHREHDLNSNNFGNAGHAQNHNNHHPRGGGVSGNYRGGNQGRGRGGNRRDDGGRGRGKGTGRGGGAGRGGRSGGAAHHPHQGYRANYTDYDAGGGRPGQEGSDMFNAY